MKEPTVRDAEKFWNSLQKEYPEIHNQLSTFAFINTSIVSFQPARMSNEDYAKYNQILRQWYIDNDFMEDTKH